MSFEIVEIGSCPFCRAGIAEIGVNKATIDGWIHKLIENRDLENSCLRVDHIFRFGAETLAKQPCEHTLAFSASLEARCDDDPPAESLGRAEIHSNLWHPCFDLTDYGLRDIIQELRCMSRPVVRTPVALEGRELAAHKTWSTGAGVEVSFNGKFIWFADKRSLDGLKEEWGEIMGLEDEETSVGSM